MSVNIKFDPSSGSQNQTVKVSGGCNPGIDETIQFQVQTEDGSKTEIINVTQEGKREVLMVSDGQGGYTEFMPSDGGTFNVVKEEWKENPNCGPSGGINPSEAPNGVYVYASDGKLYNHDSWDTQYNNLAVGVGFVLDDCKFAISKGEKPQMVWSSSLFGVDVDGLTNCSNPGEAESDLSGVNNTNVIVSSSPSENSSNNAAHYCYSQIVSIDGVGDVHGYLPSFGEQMKTSSSKSEIISVMSLIGGVEIPDHTWSSTEMSANDVYVYTWNNAFPYENSKNDDYPKALPFFPLTETGGGTEQPEPINTYFVDSDPNPALTQDGSTDKSWIVGRRCLAKKTDNGVAVCYLDENNSELFHDGVTPAVLDGTMGQWMTDLPEYYFHVDESVEGTHKFQVLPTEQADWKKSRRVLLGVTKGVIRDGKLWSVSRKKPTVSQTPIVFHNDAVACGNGFDIIDYETHCKLAHLFYTKYADRNPQAMEQFGTGPDAVGGISGTTVLLGNNDGKSDTQVVFLGVEDPYRNVFEWMGGIHRNGQTYYIYDGFEPDQVPTVPYREYTALLTNQYGSISKVEWGEHGDMIPTELSGSSTTHYCDIGAYIGSSNWSVIYRSCSYSYVDGGFAGFLAGDSSSTVDPEIGSRLQYRGNIEVIDDPATFIAMPVGF